MHVNYYLKQDGYHSIKKKKIQLTLPRRDVSDDEVKGYHQVTIGDSVDRVTHLHKV